MPEKSETTRRLKLALVIDPGPLCPAAAEFIAWCREQPALDVRCLLICKPPDHRKPGRLRCLAVNLLLRIEDRLLRSFKPNARPLQKIAPENSQLPCLDCSAQDNRNTLPAGFPADGIDLLVQIGGATVPETVLQQARLGLLQTQPAISLHASAGLPCFDEVLNRKDHTHFALIHSANGQAQTVLGGQIRTRFFTLLNQHFLFSKLRHYLQVQLLDVARTGCIAPGTHVQSTKSGDFPTLPTSLRYALGLVGIVGSELFKRKLLKRFNRWNVAFARASWRTLDLPAATPIGNRPGHFIADPFVIRDEGGDFCFVEDYDFDRQLGAIAAYKLGDGQADFLGEVIVEPHHLSFPFLFRYQGKLFMCPESSAARRIAIYECEAFPLRWRLCHLAMEGVCAADSMFFEHEGRWWLFTNIDPSNEEDCNSELMIYHADSPFAAHWTPHAQNPIYIDSAKARNGGLLTDGDQRYRVSQRQGFNAYGEGHAIHRIVTLTPDVYEEETTRTVSAADYPGVEGTHHCHADGELCVFDFRRSEAVDR